MSGYKWDPVFRVVPKNGPETIYWLTDRLTDIGSHTKIVLRYVEAMKTREDINRSLRPVMFGLRPEVEIECVILSMADQSFLAEIESALLDPMTYNVFLSLDGGVVEREVVLSNVSNAEPLSGKTVIGATFRLSVRCVDLIQRKPVMMTDPGNGVEKLANGGLEDWADASTPRGWQNNGSGTNVQEATIVDDGAFSAKVTKTAIDATYFAFSQNNAITLNAGAWYRMRGVAQGGQTDVSPSGFSIQLWNTSADGSTGPSPLALSQQRAVVGSSINKWGTGETVQQDVFAGNFVSIDVFFRRPNVKTGFVFKSSDIYNYRIHGIQVQNHFIYYDSLSLYGPVLRTGYATW